jgi:RimJ/RimL family protein N-acetyltransferase
MKQFIKKIARLLLGDYSVYHIYSNSAEKIQATLPNSAGLAFSILEKEQTESNNESLVREQSSYHGPETYSYACLKDEQIVGLCYFWHGDRYRKRNFWPLADGEAKLVQIVTIPRVRGHGIATDLIAHASLQMFGQGFKRLYARIWHSNLPSLRAFQRAGWQRVATVIEVNPLRRASPIRIRFHAKH